jgi:hypothetical protein
MQISKLMFKLDEVMRLYGDIDVLKMLPRNSYDRQIDAFVDSGILYL